MVGIAITTCKRPEQLEKTIKAIEQFGGYDKLFIHDDVERKGVAYSKNKCLEALSDCDYVFLFDDDCRPKKEGWVDFFVNSGEGHLLFMNDKLHRFYLSKGNVRYYRDCGGVFMFMTKEAINRVGKFDEGFDTWGFEHAEYSFRILGKHGEYPMLQGTEDYIYSEDYSNSEHKSVLTNDEKIKFFNKNYRRFINKIT
jgi:hypothetical protein